MQARPPSNPAATTTTTSHQCTGQKNREIRGEIGEKRSAFNAPTCLEADAVRAPNAQPRPPPLSGASLGKFNSSVDLRQRADERTRAPSLVGNALLVAVMLLAAAVAAAAAAAA
eukprot:CAMPEP_0195023412 /NCGR_PEP_ID=MMETSP0326_2-20130528/42808_1 /TAXON_ID=2866 ORGANISM="Crypthecodinium cohnii, Strain Seligo" /NCGR_SAMPLE_ID=MMETSP0326_2 /ASSEMBLY_ACC=CAM_ASM_000348 /LENGTH=113 /DNA_ID=CAMNT_0040043685 /DNA_START=64 /DNA_END=404 /DNA_ORIENTATION=-